MTKPKNNNLDIGLIFWIVVAVISIWIGVGSFQAADTVEMLKDWTFWAPALFYIVFGGMILGVAANKFSASMRRKYGKSSK